MRSSLGRFSLGKLLLLLFCLSLACAVPQLLAKKKDKAETNQAEQKRAVQALNRLTFGPRPGDVQQVTTMGVDRWIDLQLHPEKISDDAIEARLAPFRTLHMSSKEIVEEFPDNQMIKQYMEGKKSMPSDPAKRAVIEVQIARLEEKQQQRTEKTENRRNQNAAREEGSASAPAPVSARPAASDTAKTAEELAAAAAASPDATPADSNSMNAMSAANGANGTNEDHSMSPATGTSMAPANPKATPADDAEARRREDRLYADLKIQGLMDLSPDQRYKKVMAMTTADQVAFSESIRGGKGQEFLDGHGARAERNADGA